MPDGVRPRSPRGPAAPSHRGGFKGSLQRFWQVCCLPNAQEDEHVRPTGADKFIEVIRLRLHRHHHTLRPRTPGMSCKRRGHISDISNVRSDTRQFKQIQILVEPFHRMFTLDDISIQYPHADPERVPPSTPTPSPLPRLPSNHAH